MDEKRLGENCICECGFNKQIKHFERCERCGSSAFHLFKSELNSIETEDVQRPE